MNPIKEKAFKIISPTVDFNSNLETMKEKKSFNLNV